MTSDKSQAEQFASSEGGKTAPADQMRSNFGEGNKMEDDLTMSKENKAGAQSSEDVAGRKGIGAKMFDKLTGGKSGDGNAVEKQSGPDDAGAGPTMPSLHPTN